MVHQLHPRTNSLDHCACSCYQPPASRLTDCSLETRRTPCSPLTKSQPSFVQVISRRRCSPEHRCDADPGRARLPHSLVDQPAGHPGWRGAADRPRCAPEPVLCDVRCLQAFVCVSSWLTGFRGMERVGREREREGWNFELLCGVPDLCVTRLPSARTKSAGWCRQSKPAVYLQVLEHDHTPVWSC